MAAARCLGLAIFLATLAFWPLNGWGFFAPKVAVWAFGLGIAIFLSKERREGGSPSFSDKLVMTYFALLLFFTIFSAAPIASFWGISGAKNGFASAILFAATFFCVRNFNAKSADILFFWLRSANFAVVVYGFLQFFGLDPLTNFWREEAFLFRPFSTVGNPNWLASFLLLTAPLWFESQRSFESQKTDKQKNFLPLLIIGFNAFLIFLTASKGAFIALLIILILLSGRKKSQRFAFWAILIIFAAVCGGALALYYGDIFSLTRSSWERLLVWRDTLFLLWEWPWGYGLDLFRFLHPAVASAAIWFYQDLDAAISSPHNQFLEQAVNIGIGGAIFFYFLLAKICFDTWPKSRPVAIAIIAYSVSNFFSFEIPGNGLIFWTLIAYSLAMQAEFKPVKRYETFSRANLVLLVFLVWATMSNWQAAIFFERGMAKLGAGHYPSAAANFALATKTFPWERNFLLQETELLLANDNIDPRFLEKAKINLEIVQKSSGGLDPDLPVLEAWLAAKNGDEEQARLKLAAAEKTAPNSINNRKTASTVLRILGDTEGEKRQIEAFRSLLPPYWQDKESEQGRIWRKNHPWVEKFLQK